MIRLSRRCSKNAFLLRGRGAYDKVIKVIAFKKAHWSKFTFSFKYLPLSKNSIFWPKSHFCDHCASRMLKGMHFTLLDGKIIQFKSLTYSGGSVHFLIMTRSLYFSQDESEGRSCASSVSSLLLVIPPIVVYATKTGESTSFNNYGG